MDVCGFENRSVWECPVLVWSLVATIWLRGVEYRLAWTHLVVLPIRVIVVHCCLSCGCLESMNGAGSSILISLGASVVQMEHISSVVRSYFVAAYEETLSWVFGFIGTQLVELRG